MRHHPDHLLAEQLAQHLAGEFHGQVVNGYEILERAGLLRSPEDIPEVEETPSRTSPIQRSELIRKLSRILVETDSEFDRLPIFIRPVARQGFRNKAGLSLADWQRLLAALESGTSTIPANITERLEKLAAYYRDVPQETARFTRDAETLKQIARVCSERIGIIQKLYEQLKF